MTSNRVLVVDDEQPITLAVARYLASRGYEVVRAEEREEAEALLLNSCFPMVITDLSLTRVHGVEGLELISFVRKHCPGSLAILLTGNGSATVREEAERRGADAVLEKPLGLYELACAMETLSAAVAH